MYKVTVYIPESHLERVKQAMFDAGAGRISPYDHCCWQTKGTGQYRPLEGSQPYAGKQNQVSSEEEYLVELVCDDELIKLVLMAMLEAHPYETPAYAVYPIMTFNDFK